LSWNKKRSSPGSKEQEKAWPENKVFLVQNYCSKINLSTRSRDKKEKGKLLLEIKEKTVNPI